MQFPAVAPFSSIGVHNIQSPSLDLTHREVSCALNFVQHPRKDLLPHKLKVLEGIFLAKCTPCSEIERIREKNREELLKCRSLLFQPPANVQPISAVAHNQLLGKRQYDEVDDPDEFEFPVQIDPKRAKKEYSFEEHFEELIENLPFSPYSFEDETTWSLATLLKFDCFSEYQFNLILNALNDCDSYLKTPIAQWFAHSPEYLRQFIIKAMDIIPQKYDSDLLELMFIESDGIEETILNYILDTLLLIPSQDRIKIIKSMLNVNKKFGFENLFTTALAAVDYPIEEAEPYISDSLTRVITGECSNLKQAHKLAEIVLQNHVALNLYEESPLNILASQVMSVASEEALRDKKHCYTVHQSLLETVPNEELVPLPQVADINLELVRQRTNRSCYTYRDLPKTVVPTSLVKIFRSLEARMLMGSPIQKRLIAEKIENEYHHTDLRSVKALLTSGIINDLMKKAQPFSKSDRLLDTPIDNTHFFLYKIVEMIGKTDINQPSPLTTQEHLLLTFASMVDVCETGRSDAIATYYNHYVLTQNRSDLKALSRSGNFIATLIDSCIQESYNNALSSPSLIRILIGEDFKEAEIAHLTTYLKNRYHRQLGLKYHKPVFDLGTPIIPNSLFDASLEEIVQKFFAYIDFPKIKQNINLAIIHALDKDHISFQMIVEYLERILPIEYTEKAEWILDFIELNSDEEYSAITNACLLKLISAP